MTNDCICSNVPRIWRLAGVTRTVRLTVTKDGSPYDFTGLQTVLRIDRDNSDFHYEPQFTVEGDDNNIIVFTWAANKQPLGDYTIEVTVTDGSGNKDRVNWHGATGVRLVEYSNLVKGEDAAGVESDSELGLDGIFTMNGVGMDAYEEWLADGNEGSLHDYILWMQGPAREAAEVAEAQMAVIQSRADDDHTTAGSDHTRAAADHTTAESDHTRADEDHQFAFENRALAYEDHLRAEDDHTTAAADHTTAQADHAIAGSDHTRAEADHSTAASDHTTAASDHTKAGQDSTRAGSDHDIAVADHAQAEADHTRAEGDHTTAAADHTTAAADHTQAASDHTTAAADHTQAVADHAVMAGYDTRLTNVETDVTQLGQYAIPFEYGGIQGGNLIINDVRIRTKPIMVEGTGTKTVNYTVPSSIVFAGTSYAYLGQKPVKSVPSISVANGVISFSADGTFDNIRVAFKYSSGASISQTDLDACAILLGTKDKIHQDEKFTEDIVIVKKSVAFEFGGIQIADGKLVASTLRTRTLPIPVKGTGYMSVKYTIPSTLVYASAAYAYSGLTPVKAVPDIYLNGDTAWFTSDGTFDNIRFAFKHSNDSDITQEEVSASHVDTYYELSKYVETNEKNIVGVNKFDGLKYCALGDSITYGFIPRNYTGYPGKLKSFAELAAEKLNMNFVNYGISGSSLAYISGREPMCVRYTNMPNDADIITVMGGTNDIRNGIQLGQMSDRTYDTYYGALHVLFQGLYTKYIGGVSTSTGKKKIIVAMTPIKMLDSSKSSLANTIANNADILEPNFDLWANAVKEVAAFYSIPCLDMYNLSRINPHLDRTVVGTETGYTGNYNPYITDGTHPTQEGAELMSDVLVGFLKTLK